MEVDIRIDGISVVKAQIGLEALIEAVSKAAREGAGLGKSCSLGIAQAEELVARVDARTQEFLETIAKNNGYATWDEMKEIFDIDEWADYSSRFGKGLTRALRNITGQPNDRLVFWNDPEWDEGDQRVFIDGEALRSLRTVFKV